VSAVGKEGATRSGSVVVVVLVEVVMGVVELVVVVVTAITPDVAALATFE